MVMVDRMAFSAESETDREWNGSASVPGSRCVTNDSIFSSSSSWMTWPLSSSSILTFSLRLDS